MYYRDCEDDTASTSAGSRTPPTPSASHLYAPNHGPASPTACASQWPTLQSETTKEVLQSVLKVRKSWKTLRGGETVWPLELEAALLEGLESYQPDDSRETRLLGRFPRRNRFISDYIFEKTGKRRSAKQVGSRLQQLRESCGGKKLLHLLSPFRQPYPDSSASSDSSCTSPVSPAMEPAFPTVSAPQHTVVHIDILPNNAPSTAAHGTPTSPTWDSPDVVRASDHPRPMRTINPTVAFVAPAPVAAQSHFTVYSGDRVVHSEMVPLTPVPVSVAEHPNAGVLYTTALVPEYWRAISESTDPTRFTIYQEVVKDDASASLIFSATYKFVYPESRYPNGGAGFPQSPLDTNTHPFSGPNTRADMDTLISAASLDAQMRGGDSRYPMYIASNNHWSSISSRSRENSPIHGYHSPNSDCFPADLSNYVL